MTATIVTPTRHHVTQRTRRAQRAEPPPARCDSVERAAAEIVGGRVVVLLDDTGPTPEGELVIAAEKATTELVAFMVRHGSGFIIAPISVGDCERLGLPPMQTVWECGRAPSYTVTVDACSGIGTGISAADRATTLRVLADASARAEDLTRPGHVVPLRTNDGAMGRPEAAVDLVSAAGLRPVAATCTVVSTAEPTAMANADELRDFAAKRHLAVVALSDVVRWRRECERNAFAPAIVEL